MKVIAETRTGVQWTFRTLWDAKKAGAVKGNIKLQDGEYNEKLNAVVFK